MYMIIWTVVGLLIGFPWWRILICSLIGYSLSKLIEEN